MISYFKDFWRGYFNTLKELMLVFLPNAYEFGRNSANMTIFSIGLTSFTLLVLFLLRFIV